MDLKEKLRGLALTEGAWLTLLLAGYSAGGLPLLLQSAVSLVAHGAESRHPPDAAGAAARAVGSPCGRHD